MVKQALLEGIWNGSITALPAGASSRIAQAIADLAPVPIVCLMSATSLGDLRIWPEAAELMPGVSLGDVLVEELGLEVPYGALVIVETAAEAGAGQIGMHQIECLIDHALHQFVVSASTAASKPSRPKAEAQCHFGPKASFRDPGLNDRFFRKSEPAAKDAETHRAAG
jgi:hypothetical protein